MGFVIVLIIIVFTIYQVSLYNERKRYEKSRIDNAYRYKNYSTPPKTNNPIYSTDLSSLFHEYGKVSDVPPLDSLVRRAYGKGEITSGRASFQALNEEDKKTILRIAINIGNKRKKDKENSEEIRTRHVSNYKS